VAREWVAANLPGAAKGPPEVVTGDMIAKACGRGGLPPSGSPRERGEGRIQRKGGKKIRQGREGFGPGGRRRRRDEVFLLLFVHKKKILPFL
jgi:hypothetical protein